MMWMIFGGRFDRFLQERVAFPLSSWLASWSGQDNFWWAKVTNVISQLLVMLWFTWCVIRHPWMVWALALPILDLYRNTRVIEDVARINDKVTNGTLLSVADLNRLAHIIFMRTAAWIIVVAGAIITVHLHTGALYLIGGLCEVLALHLATTVVSGGTPVWRRVWEKLPRVTLGAGPVPA